MMTLPELQKSKCCCKKNAFKNNACCESHGLPNVKCTHQESLPQFLQSISAEFENKFSVMLERAGREDGESSTEWLEKIESFLRQSLTKAYQLGKENVKCFGCDDVTLPYWCVGCVNKVLNEKDKAYQAIAEMTEKANKFLSNK